MSLKLYLYVYLFISNYMSNKYYLTPKVLDNLLIQNICKTLRRIIIVSYVILHESQNRFKLKTFHNSARLQYQ